jgi:hypothetical protein
MSNARLGAWTGKLFARTRVNLFSDSVIEKLRPVVIAQIQKPDEPTPEVIDRLQDIGREARDKNIPPEQVIITFKQLWADIMESAGPRRTDQYERLRQRLVTHCIQAYYAE